VFHLFQTYVASGFSFGIYAYFKCFIYFRRMLQVVFHLDVSKVDLRENTCCCKCTVVGQHASTGVVAACMRAREIERDRGDPHACVGPCGLRSWMGVGRGSWVRQAREHCPMLAPWIERLGSSKSAPQFRFPTHCS
jgi:hypothetical protein